VREFLADLAPAKPAILLRNTNPIVTAIQHSCQRRVTGSIVLLAVRRDDVLKTATLDARQQARRGPVVEMARSALLHDPSRIRAVEQHVAIMIAHSSTSASADERHLPRAAYATQVGQYDEPHRR
jgi:hypothetical protein